MPVRAITFDFWATLFRDENGTARQQARARAFSEAAGVSEAAVAEAFKLTWSVFTFYHRDLHRTLGAEDAVRITSQTLGVTLRPRVARKLAGALGEAILEFPAVPIRGALDAVRSAAALCPVGLISDTGISPGYALRQLLDRHGFTPFFTALTFSDEVGVSKPEAPMFETAARALNVKPNELFHIGDLEPTDIVGAKAVGGQAALFAGENDQYRETTQADYAFENWEEFLSALPKIL